MKTISLQEIFESKLLKYIGTQTSVRYVAIEAMREACNKTIELAAENAKQTYDWDDVDDESYRVIDTQSILNTKNQIV